MKAEQTNVCLEAANDGGFVVWAGRQDYAVRTSMLYAGELQDCLDYISRVMTPTAAPTTVSACQTCGAIKEGE